MFHVVVMIKITSACYFSFKGCQVGILAEGLAWAQRSSDL